MPPYRIPRNALAINFKRSLFDVRSFAPINRYRYRQYRSEMQDTLPADKITYTPTIPFFIRPFDARRSLIRRGKFPSNNANLYQQSCSIGQTESFLRRKRAKFLDRVDRIEKLASGNLNNRNSNIQRKFDTGGIKRNKRRFGSDRTERSKSLSAMSRQ